MRKIVKYRQSPYGFILSLKKEEMFLIGAIILLALFLFFPISESYLGSQISKFEKQSEEFFTTVISKRIVNPEPLRFSGGSFSSTLTREGVLKFTNEERVKNEMGALRLNIKLNIAAERKIDDMFSKQYFAHISPEGIGASELALEAGYEYIIIGENLALGNFNDDEDLVAAWMASPGHRANILTKRYEDIGIAVRKGEFEGQTAWLAVQTFGVPASSCTAPDSSLKERIDANKEKLVGMEANLRVKKEEIDNMEPKRGKEYNRVVGEYNTLINTYNNLIDTTKSLVSRFNTQVKTYNDCAEGL